MECSDPVANGPGDTALKKPITGIAGCCACAAAGLAKARPLTRAMKSLRLMPSIRTLILEGKRHAPWNADKVSRLRGG